MANRPSIKGSVFGGIVEDVNKLVERERLSDAEVDRWLQPEDRALLAAPVAIASWYDIRSYTRMNEMLRDLEGGGQNAYLRERGRATAQRLLDGGLYAQLEFLSRTEVTRATGSQARFEAFERDLRKLNTLSASILNFSVWNAVPDPNHRWRYMLVVTEAVDYPEVLAWRTDGFVNGMANQHGDPDLWSWGRPAPDRLEFRMTRDL